MKHTLSVVTICFNNLDELAETCRSVNEQIKTPDEHLIIDGSTDDKIQKWLQTNQQPVYRKWIHERDKGISDAFNKGVHHATGTVIHLLNSGDKYHMKNAISIVMQLFNEDPQLMWAHSQYVQKRGGIHVISGVPFEKEKLWRGMRAVAHPTMFIKKEVYERHGTYSLDYKIAMDYDMLVRMRDEKYRFISQPLIYFAPGGASHMQFEMGLNEVKAIHKQKIGNSIRLVLWQWRQRLLNFFMQTAIGKRWFRWKNNENKTA